MHRPPASLRAAAIAVAGVLAVGGLAGAIEIGGDGAGGASVSEPAQRVIPDVADLVTVYDSGALDADTEARAVAAAQQAGARHTVRLAASIGMTRVQRGSTTVQAAPDGYAYPMGTSVIEQAAVLALMGTSVAAALSDNTLVMGADSAALRGAAAGDSVTLTAASGAPVDFVIGAVVADDVVGGTELLMTPGAAARLQLDRRSSVVIWDFPSRASIDQALADQGAVSTRIRIRRSWDPFDPDSTLGMSATKQLLGEFAYRLNSDGSVSIESSWTSANLPAGRVLLNDTVRLIARCHNVIEPALRAALAEVAAAGLGWTINTYDANRAGGCYNPRFNRLDHGSSIGFLSRHTWAMAVDTNTIGSCQGCAPPDMDCRTVRIFRRHGFAWGGNFLTPDGMHYEFVGESRDGYPYPSRYCANLTEGSLRDPDAELPVSATQRPTIFADAGLIAESAG